ncbi:16S rRNA (cytidine(1402)-2'-O)-methyltransferase [Synechococcus sp. R6-6]|uniref:16S rRNA (cytidine(1402)-2'-O)-methyltransferase n=1 Tax=unclassified Synechococcus TaxID=2626047 RepID=UPI0039C00D43
MEHPTASLYLVATPIGNREDITLRALRVLREVDWVAAEDTRHSGQLLKHFQISARLISYHEHNAAQRIPQLLKYLSAGQSVALISDAGTPAISDPGEELVRACIQAGIPVIPVPGPVAAVAALTASGLPTGRFVFEGFLPLKPSQRQARLQQLAQEERTVVLYEAPHRLRQTLQDLLDHCGPERQIVLARELTKLYESFWRGSLAAALEHCAAQPPRGEFTLLLEGYVGAVPSPNPARGGTESLNGRGDSESEAEIRQEMARLLAEGLSRSAASRQLAQRLQGSPIWTRRRLYNLSLQLEPLPSSVIAAQRSGGKESFPACVSFQDDGETES